MKVPVTIDAKLEDGEASVCTVVSFLSFSVTGVSTEVTGDPDVERSVEDDDTNPLALVSEIAELEAI